VPDLKLGDVVILDELGRIISQGGEAGNDPSLPPELAERNAVQEYYRAHIRKTVEAVLPGVQADARVLVVPAPTAAESQWTPDGAATPSAPLKSSAKDPSVRNFQLRVSVVTPSPLDMEEQERVRAALARAVGLKPEGGDSLLFGLEVAPAPRTGVAVAPPVAVSSTTDYRKAVAAPMGSSAWLIALGALAALLALAYYIRARTPGITAEQRDVLVLRIRRQLSLIDGTGDARS
jgi:flagellar biosynthesis/type III secretory pathway M-ring protein FliF/YscJ